MVSSKTFERVNSHVFKKKNTATVGIILIQCVHEFALYDSKV